VYLARPPAFSLGPRIEYNPDSLQTPGPAAYDPKAPARPASNASSGSAGKRRARRRRGRVR